MVRKIIKNRFIYIWTIPKIKLSIKFKKNFLNQSGFTNKLCVKLQVITNVIEMIFIRYMEILVTDIKKFIYKYAYSIYNKETLYKENNKKTW